MKARYAAQAKKFEHIPNVGPRVAKDFRTLGFTKPGQLKNKDPYKLYRAINKKRGGRQDICLLDVFMSVVDFMNGASPRPWWHYTPERKLRFPKM